MAEGESRLTIENSEQIIRIGFLDRNILEEAAIQKIGDQVSDLIDSTPNPRILIDFSDVDHLSSAALGMLITINNRVRAKAVNFGWHPLTHRFTKCLLLPSSTSFLISVIRPARP